MRRAKKLPVTLVSGFLGSGKTSLMKHILQNKEGLRVAVIMNEITEVNLDAMALEGSKLLQTEEKLVEMANGCICCTLREDLLLQLRELARSGDFDAVLIESSGIAEPMQVAETFFVDLMDGNDELQEEAPLDNCVTVIDASMLEEHMESLDTIDRLDPTVDTSAEGSQDIAALVFAQLEFANVVLLNKVDLLGKTTKESSEHRTRLEAIIKKINPQAKVMSTRHARVPMSMIMHTNNFSLDFAQRINSWMDDIKAGVKHVPETLEYGVSGFFWTADRPFHPKRLYEWFVTYFALKQVTMVDADDDQDNEDDNCSQEEDIEDDVEHPDTLDDNESREDGLQDQLSERKACIERYGNLFRSKGYIWIAGAERGKHLIQWQQAGSILSFESDGPRNDSIKAAQKLTFVGQYLKENELKNDLESLLMTTLELEQLASEISSGNMESLDDPFDPFPDSSQSESSEYDDELNENGRRKHSHSHRQDGAAEDSARPRKITRQMQ